MSGIRKVGNVAVGLRLAWTQLKINFQAVATVHSATDDSFLLAQPLARAGFFNDGSQPKSVTHPVTLKLKERWAHDLDVRLCNDLPRGSYEHWSWEANSSNWCPDGWECPSWFSSHVAEGYGACAQFMYGRNYAMP